MMRLNRTQQLAILGLSTLVGLTGCGIGGNTGAGNGTTATAITRMTGNVFGGQQPVSGATIQLYTVGTGGVASLAFPLIASPGTTGGQGQFTITGSYSCSTATQVYITATGGNSGSGTNGAISMMAALGPCSGLSSGTFITINELTTVAAVYALAPFMTDYQHIGGSGANPTGLVNAFATASALVNPYIGQIAATPAGITLPFTRLNTLADILASCINTAGASSSQCTTLFTATGAAETIGAGLAIAKTPGASANTSLYTLASGTPPFVPTLSAKPNDFTLAINYSGAELLGPYGIAVDANGNAWVSNQAGRSVTRLPAPAAAFSTTSFTGSSTLLAPRGVSIDRSGNVWIANTGGNSVVELSSAGATLSGTGFTGGSLNAPVAIANDSANNAWVANFNGNSITELGPAGTASGASPITSSLSAPSGIALDSAGRVAVSNAGTGTVCIFSNAAVLQSCPTDGTLFGATALAVSSGGNIALAGSTTGPGVNGAFTLASNTGSVNAASPVLGGGLALPVAVAYDGNGTAWFANTASLSAFSGAAAVTPSTGYGTLNSPQGIAVDPSGNVWTANSGDNSVSIFVGLAAPATTPLAANVGP